jgi:hypothetical protein
VVQASGLAGAMVAGFYTPAGTPAHLRAFCSAVRRAGRSRSLSGRRAGSMTLKRSRRGRSKSSP